MTTPKATALFLAMLQNATDVDLTDADKATAAELAERVAAALKPGEPLMALYPVERGQDGALKWERTGRWINWE